MVERKWSLETICEFLPLKHPAQAKARTDVGMRKRIVSNFAIRMAWPIFFAAVVLLFMPMTAAQGQSVRCPATAVDTAGWSTQNEGYFSLKIPPRFEDVEIKSIDSKMGKWRAGNATIWYDFGRYSYPLNSVEQRSISDLMVCQKGNGPDTPRVVVYRDEENGMLRMDAYWALEESFGSKALTINGAAPDERSRTELLAVIRSVHFHTGGK